MNPQPIQEQSAQTGIHPTTTTDINQQSSMNQPSRTNGGVWMQKPETMAGALSDQKDTVSAVSSTPSEYGSDDTSHRSPHAEQRSERPVADKDAFIQSSESSGQWQTKMSPAERAKQLAAEMDQNIERRRSSSSSIGEKILKIGGKKEYKLD